MDRFLAMETLGLGADARAAEVEASYRRRRSEAEATLASAPAEPEREAARKILRDLEAARETLLARARAREDAAGSAGPASARSFDIDEGPAPRTVAPPPKPPAGPSGRVLHSAPLAPVAPPEVARKRRLLVGISLAAALVVGLAVWAFLPSGGAADPGARRREAEKARAQWQGAIEKAPGAASERATKDAQAAADALAEAERLASKGEPDAAAEAYESARDRWRAAATLGEVDVLRAAAREAAAALDVLAKDKPPATASGDVKSGREALAEGEAQYGGPKQDLAKAKKAFEKARRLLGPAAANAARSLANRRLSDLEAAIRDAQSRMRSALTAGHDAGLDAEDAAKNLEAAEPDAVRGEERKLVVALRRAREYAAAHAAWDADPPGEAALKSLADRLSAARKGANARSEDPGPVVAEVETALAAVLARLVAMEAALAPPAAPAGAVSEAAQGEWTLDPSPLASAAAAPPALAAALSRAAPRLAVAADGTFSMVATVGGEGAGAWSLAGTWAPGPADGGPSIATTTWVEGRAPTAQAVSGSWGGALLALSPKARTFAFRDPAAKDAPSPEFLARLAPAWAAELAGGRGVLAALRVRREAIAAAETAAADRSAQAKSALGTVPEGKAVVDAARECVAAAQAVRAARARVAAWDERVAGDPAWKETDDALAAAAKALEDPGRTLEALDRCARARSFAAALEPKAKEVEDLRGVGVAEGFAGTWTLAMDAWLAPEKLKFAIAGSQVRLDLAEDGAFVLATDLSGRFLVTAGRWEPRVGSEGGDAGTRDVSLEALVEDRTVLDEGKPWGDAFVRLIPAKKAFGFKTAKYAAPIPWLVRVQPEIAEGGTGKPLVSEPAEGALVASMDVRVRGRVEPVAGGVLTVNGKKTTLTRGEFTQMVKVEAGEGERQIEVVYAVPRGSPLRTTRLVRVDTVSPRIVVAEPADPTVKVAEPKAVLRGYVEDLDLATLTLDGEPLAFERDGDRARFEATVTLAAAGEEKTVVLRAVDRAGNPPTIARRVVVYAPP